MINVAGASRVCSGGTLSTWFPTWVKLDADLGGGDLVWRVICATAAARPDDAPADLNSPYTVGACGGA